MTCKLSHFNIISKESDFDVITQRIQENDTQDMIFLRGAIYKLMKKLLVSSKNAITGGELFNDNNGVDGMAMESDSELTDMIRDIACNPAKYLKIGK